jgi:RNA polymerase sigma-70 factor (ECF subfamily)
MTDVTGSQACRTQDDATREEAGVVTPSGAVGPDLLRRARAGDRAARETLARTSGDAAFRFALQLTGDRDRARDIAQDSVLRLFATLRRVDPDRPFTPWLFSIVRNRVTDVRRRDRVRSEGPWRPVVAVTAEGVEAPAPDPPDSGPSPHETSERTELQRLLWSCLGRLDRAHREILVLRDYQDLSYREIAEVLCIPLGTVMSRLHVARRKLRSEVLATGYRFGGGS